MSKTYIVYCPDTKSIIKSWHQLYVLNRFETYPPYSSIFEAIDSLSLCSGTNVSSIFYKLCQDVTAPHMRVHTQPVKLCQDVKTPVYAPVVCCVSLLTVTIYTQTSFTAATRQQRKVLHICQYRVRAQVLITRLGKANSQRSTHTKTRMTITLRLSRYQNRIHRL